MARPLTTVERHEVEQALGWIRDAADALMTAGDRSALVQAVAALDPSPRGRLSARERIADYLARQEQHRQRITQATDEIARVLAAT